MDCRAVRDLLPEHALGTLAPDAAREVRAHLAWCAGCRKEAGELAEGAELLGRAPSPARPPRHLEERVVQAVRAAAGRVPRLGRRRATIALAVAAALFTGALGWAVAMTGRAERLEDAAATATTRAEEFEALVAELLRETETGRALTADLRPVSGSQGGGRALVSDSPGGYDWTLMIAGGLPEERGPYSAYLLTAEGRERVGRLHPAANGEVAAYRIFEKGITRVLSAWVTDGRGETVLRASL